MSATTRDWLLQKLLKMKESLIAVTAERDEAREERDEFRSRFIESQNNEQDLVERIRQLSPQKQFAVNLRGPNGINWRCQIDSVNSANGSTLITVQLPATFIREYGLYVPGQDEEGWNEVGAEGAREPDGDEPWANNGVVSSGAVPAGTTPISYGAGLGRHRC